jgi:predicted metal-dependent hydrolase
MSKVTIYTKTKKNGLNSFTYESLKIAKVMLKHYQENNNALMVEAITKAIKLINDTKKYVNDFNFQALENINMDDYTAIEK